MWFPDLTVEALLGTEDQLLHVFLNWAKRVITDTCAYKTECACRITGASPTYIYSCVPFGAMAFCLSHKNSEALSRRHLRSPPAIGPIGRFYMEGGGRGVGGVWAEAHCSCSDAQQATYPRVASLISASSEIHGQHSYSCLPPCLPFLTHLLVSSPAVV